MKRCKITVLKTTLNEELAKDTQPRDLQVSICSCNDGLRPVIMKDEEAQIPYEPIKG